MKIMSFIFWWVSEIEAGVEHSPAVVEAPGSSPWNPTSLDRLPGSASDDPFTRLAAAFLVSYAESTARPTSVTSRSGTPGA